MGGVDDLDRYGAHVPDLARRLARAYWPGPLTLIVEAGDAVPAAFRSAAGSIGLRMPDNDTALELIEAVGCPLVLHPDLLIAMNRPSLEKFAADTAPGGVIVYDSALAAAAPVPGEGVRLAPVAAAPMAETEGLDGLANMILLGRALAETGFAALDVVEAAIRKCIPPKKQHLAAPNLRALHLGMSV